jgi:organic hydroperoxide reductase OsmC/OhrA
MTIEARIRSTPDGTAAEVATEGRSHAVALGTKPDGRGAATNGGELLCLALATCYFNDVYREATARGVRIDEVDVSVEAEFGGAGEPARNIAYRVRATSADDAARVRELLLHTDRVAEIHNTVRGGCTVSLVIDT